MSTFSITPLLKLLAQYQDAEEKVVTDDLVTEITAAFAGILGQGEVTDTQRAALLTALTFTGLYNESKIVSAVVKTMREAAVRVPLNYHDKDFATKKRLLKRNNYHGGFVDIVGTGGDGHNTFNVSTTSALLASPYLLVAKHGNRAATSVSGSSDMISALAGGPHILNIAPEAVGKIFANYSNLAFLFAPTYHTSLGSLARVRKELGFSTIFNVVGPLSNPIEGIEARILGVKNRELGKVFSEVLQLMGCQKGMVVCGDVGKGLDEISPCGKTFCWRLIAAPPGSPSGTLATIEEFELHPVKDFGVPLHPLEECKSLSPHENADIVKSILRNEVAPGNPIMDYCLINSAALLVVAGVTDDWKDAVDLIKEGLKEQASLKQWEGYLAGCKAYESDKGPGVVPAVTTTITNGVTSAANGVTANGANGTQ
ncbi:anthranilate phosphoribosyltransferase [Orbilia blumenaviensis]|uniref:Anthranilate phosphoribosyltransferase n=1 Tax=Orbilia blumenaviensis TaxID=1796055 RepID=A0AAV9VNT6_9PEZI